MSILTYSTYRKTRGGKCITSPFGHASLDPRPENSFSPPTVLQEGHQASEVVLLPPPPAPRAEVVRHGQAPASVRVGWVLLGARTHAPTNQPTNTGANYGVGAGDITTAVLVVDGEVLSYPNVRMG